jgi:hypothetical protein
MFCSFEKRCPDENTRLSQRPADAARYQTYQEQHQEYDKQNLADIGEGRGNAAETKYGSDQRENQKRK